MPKALMNRLSCLISCLCEDFGVMIKTIMSRVILGVFEVLMNSFLVELELQF